MYLEANANPKHKKTNDCVVRSIALATGQTWYDTYDGLCATGREMAMMPNDKRVYTKYLERLGWQKHTTPRNPYGRTITLGDFTLEMNRPAIASIRKHLTFVDNQKVHDTWDCTGYRVGNYWTKK